MMKRYKTCEIRVGFNLPKQQQLEWVLFDDVKGWKSPEEIKLMFGKITRIVVIEDTTKIYEKWNSVYDFSFQDDGRTLKIFVDRGGGQKE